jgi:thiazole tautomerase (transcriptional regulator TenI)
VREIPVIHAVTSDEVLARAGFVAQARAVMGALGRRGAVHLRAPHLPVARLFDVAEALAAEQEASGAWVAVNDRVDVALATGARAVQLTSRSMRIADARRLAAGVRLGASVHAAAEAAAAEREGADWVVAGHVFETTTHRGEAGRGLPFIEALRRATVLPCIAIGGIRPSRVGRLLAAGVHGVAAISGIWDADDAERAVIEYLSEYDRHRNAQ